MEISASATGPWDCPSIRISAVRSVRPSTGCVGAVIDSVSSPLSPASSSSVSASSHRTCPSRAAPAAARRRSRAARGCSAASAVLTADRRRRRDVGKSRAQNRSMKWSAGSATSSRKTRSLRAMKSQYVVEVLLEAGQHVAVAGADQLRATIARITSAQRRCIASWKLLRSTVVWKGSAAPSCRRPCHSSRK